MRAQTPASAAETSFQQTLKPILDRIAVVVATWPADTRAGWSSTASQS